MRNKFIALVAAVATIAFSATASAGSLLWGNTATFGPVQLAAIDPVTGALTTEYTVMSSGNGRGMVVVGNTIYWTVVGDPHIYMSDKTTGAAMGSILTSNQSMSTIAWDGTAFWTSDYNGTNQAFRIDPVTGNNIQTITLSNAQQYMDGMEFFYDASGNARLIANRCDACGDYDIYDTNGNLIQANFINAGFAGTGIAYDGTNFYVSDIYNQRIAIYSGTTGAFISAFTYTPGFSGPYSLIEDLSFDYTITLPPTVPEPSTLVLMSTGALGLIAAARRRRKRA